MEWLLLEPLGWLWGALGSLPGAICCVLLPLAPFWAVWRVWQTAQARQLQAVLQSRGWQWVTPADALVIYRGLGKRAFDLPPYDQIATLPGYWRDDARTLVWLVKEMEKARKV